MHRDRQLGLVISASLHSALLIGIAGGLALPSHSVIPPRQQDKSIQIEIVDVSDLRDHVFDFDIEKIRSRIGRLFPFTEPILFPSTQVAGKGSTIPTLGMAHLAEASIPLRLSESEIQAVLDASWSRRQRWDSFQPILDLVQRFDPQDGDLPTVLRRYSSGNLLQPFNASQNPEPRIWGLLSVAADHLDFAQFIASFIGKVPSSKATTELLFLLDKLVQANLNTAISLLNLDTVKGIEWTRILSPNGADVLVALHAYQERALSKRGLWDEAALAFQYDEVRIGILEHVIRTTPKGYRANDARFLIGEIYWRQRRQREALHVWSQIEPDAADEYVDVYSEVRANIGSGVSERTRVDVALNEQMRRWTDASLQRLHYFGYTFETF